MNKRVNKIKRGPGRLEEQNDEMNLSAIKGEGKGEPGAA